LDIGQIVFGRNDNGAFVLVGGADNASNQTIHPGGGPLTFDVRFNAARIPACLGAIVIPSNDPADGGTPGRVVPLQGAGQYNAPIVQFIAPNGAVTAYVRVGLWDRAWDPATGNLFNASAANANFIGRDSRYFTIRVTDEERGAAGALTVTVQWWTRCTPLLGAEQDDDTPASRDITLEHTGGNIYESKPLMLVTDTDDRDQGTHDGLLVSAGVVARGAANHRLRLITVSPQNELNHRVRASYAHNCAAHATPVVANADVFDRAGLGERKRVHVHFRNVRATNGGLAATTNGELTTYANFIRTIYARAGIFAEIDMVDVNPPATCTGWAEDPGICVAMQELSGGSPMLVPHPTQNDLIQAIGGGRQANHVYLFFVANIFDMVTDGNAGGEAFYLAQSTHPANSAAALANLNIQARAHDLARRMSDHVGAGIMGVTAALAAARAAASLANTMLAQANAFIAEVIQEQLNRAGTVAGGALQNHINAANAATYANPGYVQTMTDSRGCGFLVTRLLLGSDVAPAHEMTHILTNLDNAADGHFDLENPAGRPVDGQGNELPGHIDGKNLMHRYALGGGGPVGVNIPKRLWDYVANNATRGMNIPAQIASILANPGAGFIVNY
jgi:hypothetical protein